MKILITGSKGFVGKNLVENLKNFQQSLVKSDYIPSDVEFLCLDKDDDIYSIKEHFRNIDILVHLAGVNRPQNVEEFFTGNVEYLDNILKAFESYENYPCIILSSSIQAELDNPYGKSKKQAEELVKSFAKKHDSRAYIYRFSNLFGKWCKPNYNSVVATFCYNIARDIAINIVDGERKLNLCYIDDVLLDMYKAMANKVVSEDYYRNMEVFYTVSVNRIAELIYSFKHMRKTLDLPNLLDPFEKKLYSTYLSYLPLDDFAYPLTTHADNRGSFTEIIKTISKGQFSVNIIKPGYTKGNHWHNTKNEKFLVVSGFGKINFRSIINEEEVISYSLSSENLQVVDIPVGYTHNITNESKEDMVVFMWCNEPFDPQNPDTFFNEV